MLPISPRREDRQFAADLFARYKRKAGSDFIASETALAYLSSCLRAFGPGTVIECGAGIGTITEALLSHISKVDRVISIESDPFCLDAFRQNIGQRRGLSLITNADELSALKPSPDLIIIDGNDASFEAISRAKPGTVIFIEGNRRYFREACEDFLTTKNLLLQLCQYGASRQPKNKGCWIGQVTQNAPI